MFCIEKVNVASNALRRPIKLKDISVAVAIITPPTTGINEQYTCRVHVQNKWIQSVLFYYAKKLRVEMLSEWS